MGYTIIFGLMATTIITLFVVKSLYYELYMKEKKPRRWTRILPWKWTIWKRFMRQDTSMKQARESHRAQTLKQHTEKSVQSLIDTPEK